MVNYGNGFTWSEVYFMPIHWRNFYFKKLLEAKKKEKEEHDKASKKKGGRVTKCKCEEVILPHFFFVLYLYKNKYIGLTTWLKKT